MVGLRDLGGEQEAGELGIKLLLWLGFCCAACQGSEPSWVLEIGLNDMSGSL